MNRAPGAGGAGLPQPARAGVSLGTAAAFLLIAVLVGAVLWRGHFRVGLVLLTLLAMILILLSGMGRP